MKCRGLRASPSQSALYGVFDNKLFRVDRDGARTELGSLVSRTGYVDFAFGTRQLVIVDGANGYVLTLATGALARITAPGWLGSTRVGYLRGAFLFHDPGTGKFYISNIEDGADVDALDFATASSSPDDIVAILDDHGEAALIGEVTTEVWPYTGAQDFPLEHNEGADMAVGCLAAFTARVLGGARYWLGRDASGAVAVYRATGYVPEPISHSGLNDKLAKCVRDGADMSKAIAFAQADGDHGFYWLQVPGLDTTWVFDSRLGKWHERSDFRYGAHTQHRAKFHAYCFGRHLVAGSTTGEVWELDAAARTNAGDPLVRDRISPHYALPTNKPIKFGPFELDCRVGDGKADGTEAFVALRYSDDGGKTWSGWAEESLGALGEYGTRVRWHGLGSAHDRVWHVRAVDQPLAIIRALVQGG